MHFSLVEKLGASALLCAWLVYGCDFGHVFVHVRAHRSTMEVAKPPAAPARRPRQRKPISERCWRRRRRCRRVDFQQVQSLSRHREGRARQGWPQPLNVVGGPKAHAEGFAYSPTLAGIHSQTSTYQDLFTFLANPKQYIAGTKMTFAGLSDGKDLAAVSATSPPTPRFAAAAGTGTKTAAAETSQPAASGKEATQAAARPTHRTLVPQATSRSGWRRPTRLRREGVRQVQGLPQRREGRPEPGRPKPVGRP